MARLRGVRLGALIVKYFRSPKSKKFSENCGPLWADAVPNVKAKAEANNTIAPSTAFFIIGSLEFLSSDFGFSPTKALTNGHLQQANRNYAPYLACDVNRYP